MRPRSTHIIGFVKEYLCYGEKYSVCDGKKKTPEDIQLREISQINCTQFNPWPRTQLCLDKTIQFFHTRMPNCLQKSPAMMKEGKEKRNGRLQRGFQ